MVKEVKHIKDLNSDNFFTTWETTHNKGVFSYLLKNTAPSIIFIIIINIIYIIQYSPKTEMLRLCICFSALIILINILSNFLKWVNSEKKYMNRGNS